MENLDLTTIINRVRDLSTATPVFYKGHDGEERECDASLLAATIVGAAIGSHCTIPPRSIPTATSYFASTFGDEIQAVISTINEAVNIRTQVAYDAACAVWYDRYLMVHQPCDLDSVLQRLASTGSNNFTNVLLSNINEAQRESLEKLYRSVNLSCSKVANGNMFNK